MTTNLKIVGPFTIHCPKNGAAKFIDAAEKREFLQAISSAGVGEKHGCYIFATRAGQGFCPWYVGKATKGMSQECMGNHQLQHYNAVLAKGEKGTPVMFFAVHHGTRKKVPAAICGEMEEVLIQAALYENPELRNVQKARVPVWGIDGVIRGRKGKPTRHEKCFKKMMGL